ncbi:ribosome biogenesis factor YjgA [Pseudorhodoferax sp. Leaf267]|uniref:ribosome biogenesis factor YjgA n=1 Tax=Pseudorhodoferax sp. Leaf267 TaxID=1736316 RepID=UPI0006F77061|nr:ribosome biogenesis factor YjgA [Pseudorhodoferax sp. Leaf267]KQP22019.1 ribosome-associated protein [Pseudorhodoferax sp. Leaf267]
MPRKFKKGYFVQGQFVAEGSELDLQLKAELKGTDSASRTDLKRESTALQELGEQLLGLRPEQLEPLALPEKLQEAIAEARRITNFEGKRRQIQFIGKLMRKLEDDTVAQIRQALADQHGGTAREVAALHQAEQWRDALVADDDALARWLEQFPSTDAQQLRSLVRQARKDAKPEKPGLAPRHGRAYREIFQLVRTQLTDEGTEDEHDDHA